MDTKEYTGKLDRSKWSKGPWDDEPQDKRQWQDPETGLPCLIKRNDFGAWCGYVGVADGHPLFGMDYDKAEGEFAIDVHGGLTFADFCDPRGDAPGADPAKYICHIAGPGEPEHVWWLGFDTAHAWDITPNATRYYPGNTYPGNTYRDIVYVTSQVTSLARQLKSLEK